LLSTKVKYFLIAEKTVKLKAEIQAKQMSTASPQQVQ
jgi:hypothetical protein